MITWSYTPTVGLQDRLEILPGNHWFLLWLMTGALLQHKLWSVEVMDGWSSGEYVASCSCEVAAKITLRHLSLSLSLSLSLTHSLTHSLSLSHSVTPKDAELTEVCHSSLHHYSLINASEKWNCSCLPCDDQWLKFRAYQTLNVTLHCCMEWNHLGRKRSSYLIWVIVWILWAWHSAAQLVM